MNPAQFIREYERALATQDWQTVEPLFHADACVTFSNGTYKGKPAVREAFERTFSLIKDEEYSISNLYWVLQDFEYAVCLYNFSWSGTIDGQRARGAGRGTSVLTKKSGSWQILTEHLGPDAA